ncbi:hypothetical protein GCM10009416_28150 [Craurococcus roseus]|uniref:Uncharacterized protein n=1 Tax=Craurococcus roseus TaxID=77585 RepID=A0ABN1FCM0_9PROT
MMFQAAVDGDAPGAFAVGESDGFAGQSATFRRPDARARAEAYARWMNEGGAFQRCRAWLIDPGSSCHPSAKGTRPTGGWLCDPPDACPSIAPASGGLQPSRRNPAAVRHQQVRHPRPRAVAPR